MIRMEFNTYDGDIYYFLYLYRRYERGSTLMKTL
ncbi:Uncharacterised protein [Shigella sonnei]|nr:Uncharacterised protein [Shigella sonnei]